MSDVAKTVKEIITANGVESFQSMECLKSILSSKPELSVLEKNLLLRCADYGLFPEDIYANESAANRQAQRIVSALTKRHGIEEEIAQQIALEICKGFSEGNVSMNVFQQSATPVPKRMPVAPLSAPATEEKTKKKGLFSIFKKG